MYQTLCLHVVMNVIWPLNLKITPYLDLVVLMVEKMNVLREARVRMGPSSVVIRGWTLYSTVVYLHNSTSLPPF